MNKKFKTIAPDLGSNGKNCIRARVSGADVIIPVPINEVSGVDVTIPVPIHDTGRPYRTCSDEGLQISSPDSLHFAVGSNQGLGVIGVCKVGYLKSFLRSTDLHRDNVKKNFLGRFLNEPSAQEPEQDFNNDPNCVVTKLQAPHKHTTLWA